MSKNLQTHQAEVEAWASGPGGAEGRQPKALMAIADTVQKIQMAGCMQH